MPMARTVVNDGIHSLKNTANESIWIHMNHMNPHANRMECLWFQSPNSQFRVILSMLVQWQLAALLSGSAKVLHFVLGRFFMSRAAAQSFESAGLPVTETPRKQKRDQITPRICSAHESILSWISPTQIHAFRDANLQIATSCKQILRQKSCCYLSISSRLYSYKHTILYIHVYVGVCT
jgi:hypothetical protein